ncbi:hypothetical protein JZ751_027891 [Albula glossodonta]|uniref:FZ domain-containing protein n=1 Tax=Albula glossodonta TaxID=121402 RepID=A0A8T2PIY8_9TELE|nr:hypothetical protein JZ751_027891 [Albula glossodonta]
MAKIGMWLGLYLLMLCLGHSYAWFWNWGAPTTEAPPVTHEGSGAPVASGEEPEDNIAGVGAEIIDVASGIRKIVQTWDQNPDAKLTTAAPTPVAKKQGVISGGAKHGNGMPQIHGVKFESASRGSAGEESGSASGSSVVESQEGTDLPSIVTGLVEVNGTREVTTVESPRCLLLDSDFPFCTTMGQESFAVPNFLNQSSVEEVLVVLREWAWLLNSRCHHSLEWFFCLLLVPRCGPPGLAPAMPCRSFCEVLRDSCWTLLDEGRLPMACHSLPEEEDDGYQCLSVSNQKDDNGVSLLQLIGDPPPDEITKVYGPDNSPGYVFGPDANTGQLARAHFPSPFYRDFSLLFNLQPTSTKAGVIFSITDASQQIMYVGVKLSALKAGHQQIILYYTEPDSQTSYEAASFSVPSLVNTWSRFSISVADDQVSFFASCDSDPQVLRFERSPDDMELEAGAGVFVGQAGGADTNKFLASGDYGSGYEDRQKTPSLMILAGTQWRPDLCNQDSQVPKVRKGTEEKRGARETGVKLVQKENLGSPPGIFLPQEEVEPVVRREVLVLGILGRRATQAPLGHQVLLVLQGLQQRY